MRHFKTAATITVASFLGIGCAAEVDGAVEEDGDLETTELNLVPALFAAVPPGAVTLDAYTSSVDSRVRPQGGWVLTRDGRHWETTPGLAVQPERDGQIVGGERDVRIEGDLFANFSGQAFNNSATLELSTLTLTYDGLDGDAESLDVDGLGGIPLADQMQLQLASIDTRVDPAVRISVTVYDVAGRSSIFTDGRHQIFGTCVRECVATVPVSAFMGDADFARVGAVVLTLEQQHVGLDMRAPVVSFFGDPPTPPSPSDPRARDPLCENIAFVCSLPAVNIDTCFSLLERASAAGVTCD